MFGRGALKTLSALLAIAAIAVALSGCDSKPDDGPPPIKMTQETLDANIKKIQDDPNMTPQAKQAAIAGMQRGLESSKNAQPAGKRPDGK